MSISANFLAYCLQVGVLIGIAGWIPAALKLRPAKARLIFWHALLAACLTIPLVQPWRSEVVTATVRVSPAATVTAAPVAAHRGSNVSPAQIALAILLAGFLARLTLLAAGLWRLRRYRRNSIPLDPAPTWAVEADVRLSSEISSPVTFGLNRPVVLLPADFPELDPGLQEAILCHEVLHVRRRDWAVMLGEELVRAGLWFHPAIWWLLGEIQLAREQSVDSEVIEMTKAREQYVDALLAVAGAALQLDLAPAPLFLRKRHLKHRVFSILKETKMSKTRSVSTLAAGLAMIAGAGWLATEAFPLWAAPQAVTDGFGVTVDVQGAKLMHRSPVFFPRDAQLAGVEGTVMAQVTLDANGNVSDEGILSGPAQLRKPVLESLLTWHFTKEAAGTSRQVIVTFKLPDPGTAAAHNQPAATSAQRGTLMMMPPAARLVEGKLGAVSSDEPVTVKAIQIEGMEISSEELMAKLPPLHIGEPVSRQTLGAFVMAVRQLDEHLSASVSFDPGTPNTATVHVRPNGYVAARVQADTPKLAQSDPNTIPVGGRVQNAKLVSQTTPEYPLPAKNARISGTVELAALIGPDGHVKELNVISGHPLLRQSALDAVKGWVYAPTLLNNNPVSVSTTIDVVFSLNQ